MEKGRKGLNPLYGIGLFIFVILVSLFAFAPIQWRLGMYGLAVTELMLLLIAVGAALLFRQNLREVFPVKRPSLRQIFGTLSIWLGSYLAVMAVTMILGYFFPEGILGVSQGLSEVLQSVPVWMTFLIAAVMPAICEEAVHRGFILYTFQNVKNKWVIITAMGAIFGLFHLDPYRFLPTALLGAALTYIMVETKNILLPMLFHLVNNAPSAFSALLTAENTEMKAAADALDYIPLASVGSFLMFACVVPFLLLLGTKLLKNKKETLKDEAGENAAVIEEEHKQAKRSLWITAITSIFLFGAGMIIMFLGVLKDPVFRDLLTNL